MITHKRGDFENNELHLKSGVTSKGNYSGSDAAVLFRGKDFDYSAFIRGSHFHPGDGKYTDSQFVSYDRQKDHQDIASTYANLYFEILSWNIFYDKIRY